MGTVLDLLKQSTMLVGLRASGEELDAELAQDCLTVLNQLIDSWALEALLVYTLNRHVMPLVASQQTYTIGPGGNLDIPRPVRIDDVNWRDESQAPALELSLTQLTRQAYHGLWTRELTSSRPTSFYYEPSSPLGTLFLHPSPTLAKKVVVWVWKPWVSTDVDQLTDELAFPPGYQRFVVHALAVDLGQQPGARLSPQTIRIAADTRALIEDINTSTPVLGMPAGLFGRRHRTSGSYYDHISTPG